MLKHLHRLTLALAILFAAGCWGLALAREASVAPGVNAPYASADYERWTGVFEAEGREVYDRRQDIVAALGLRPGMAVADVGAGTGLFTRLFSQAVGPAGRVYAVDIAPEFIAAIQRTAREQGLANVAGIVNRPDDVGLPAESIDLAFLSDTYHHLEYPISMLASIRKALRPGGQLVIVDYERIPGVSSPWVMGHVRAGKETVLLEVETAGFRLLEDRPLLAQIFFLRFERRP